jgi:uncharacterized membrane protein YkoI
VKVNRMLILFVVALAMFSVLGVASPKAAHAQQNTPACSYKPTGSADGDNVQYHDQGGNQNEQASNDSNDAAPTGTPTITEAQAKQAAEACVPDATVTKITLDDENGVLVYSVEFGSVDVKVDAKTGTVIRIDKGTDNENGSQQQSEGESSVENNG